MAKTHVLVSDGIVVQVVSKPTPNCGWESHTVTFEDMNSKEIFIQYGVDSRKFAELFIEIAVGGDIKMRTNKVITKGLYRMVAKAMEGTPKECKIRSATPL